MIKYHSQVPVTSKIWGKKPKASTEVTTMSHQQVIQVNQFEVTVIANN